MDRLEMQKRRLEAAPLLLAGMAPAAVGKKFGVSRTTACRWKRALNEGGIGKLYSTRTTGRPPRLSAAQCQRLVEIIRSGPLAAGFDHWTAGNVVTLIEREFGVLFDRDHVGRMVNKLGLRRLRPMGASKKEVNERERWVTI